MKYRDLRQATKKIMKYQELLDQTKASLWYVILCTKGLAFMYSLL